MVQNGERVIGSGMDIEARQNHILHIYCIHTYLAGSRSRAVGSVAASCLLVFICLRSDINIPGSTKNFISKTALDLPSHSAATSFKAFLRSLSE